MKVSVIIPIYNAYQFLDTCIRSALAQVQTSELLLIDDRSTDDSMEICKKWESIDSRVKVFVNTGTKGAGPTRNVGIKNATCDYIAFLDADDYYLEGRFNTAETLFLNNPNIDAVGETVEVIDDHSCNLYGFSKQFSIINIYDFLTKPSFYIIGLTVKKSSALKIGYFDENLKQAEDTDYMVRLISQCFVISGKYDTPVAVYRMHSNNTIASISERNFYRRMFFKKYLLESLDSKFNIQIFYYFLRRYFIYDYLVLFDNRYQKNKILKAFCIPIHLVRLFK